MCSVLTFEDHLNIFGISDNSGEQLGTVIYLETQFVAQFLIQIDFGVVQLIVFLCFQRNRR